MYLFIGGMVFVYKSHTGFTQERNDYLKKKKQNNNKALLKGR